VNGNHFRAVKGDGGTWVADVDLEHGDNYRIEIDGKVCVPDPRSPRQPNGVQSFSQHVDHSLFEWTDTHWQAQPLSSAILYELHVGTFTEDGTFEAAVE
jgi:maltooligosyltrehalose trehalohydrolase